MGRYFPEIVEAVASSGDGPYVADAEIVRVADGSMDFDQLQLRLHPAESRVRKLAGEIAANAPLAVHAGKAMVYAGIQAMGMPAALDAADALFGPVNRSEDAEEGFRAMAERRPPQWKGR